MKEFVPSDSFVDKTMDAIRACEEANVRRPHGFVVRMPASILQTVAFVGGLVMTIVQAFRLYYAVFAPIISQ